MGTEYDKISITPRLTRALREIDSNTLTTSTNQWSFDNLYLIAKDLIQKKKSKDSSNTIHIEYLLFLFKI